MIINYNQTYSLKDIEIFANDNNLCLEDYGKFILGQGFLCVSDDKRTYSFIFIGYNEAAGYYYKCIYCDK
jgi:hypothetical protein